ncbi:xylulokinase [Jiangella rhizosphaerae]|uniref:xylulokinase n=1 Tax=Jiangella rhizosphaerae TaxID=2293569 RepID=UPI0013144D7F|nr:FGGY family carbohydrate kinase [Jiangella rhizosphaerae]
MTGDAVLALDLGTGGCKATLWSADAVCLADAVVPYPTSHPAPGRNEQRTSDWWQAVVTAVRRLAEAVPDTAGRVAAVGLSGQSLGVVQVGAAHETLRDATPIWSDIRATAQAEELFRTVDERSWYEHTGNGFTPALYPLVKAAWLRQDDPAAWARTRYLLGSKDWLNLRLTGEIGTDVSYASGSGALDIRAGRYDVDLLAAAGLDPGLLPEPRPSTDVLGGLSPAAAGELGLRAGTTVVLGAVDNACMALGSLTWTDGAIYAALGSSSWITVSASQPLVEWSARPYVFRHAVEGQFLSALSTFSSGTSLEWLRELVAPDLTSAEFIGLGAAAASRTDGPVFLPMLAGGTPLEGGAGARGAVVGLDLATGRADLARAALEGIAFALRRSLDRMRELSGTSADVLLTGGGSRHDGWNQIYADILGVPLVRTTVDQQAATLGAAAIAFVGSGLWSSFEPVDAAHVSVAEYVPQPSAAEHYARLRARFDALVADLAPRGS